MASRSLPLVRRGIRIVWLGLLVTLSPYLVSACCQGFLGGLPGVVEYVLPWVFATGISTCLAGIALTTSAPRESGVPRWAYGILAGSTLAWAWPLVVWSADLPAAAYPDAMETLVSMTLFFALVAFTGLLSAVCRWFAANEPPKLPGERSGQWTRLARNTTWLFRAGCIWMAIVGTFEFGMELAMEWLGMAVLMLFPVVMLVQSGAMITAPLWVIWFIVTAVRFELACRRSTPRAESPATDQRPESVARLDRLGLTAGMLAIVAFVAGWLTEEPMGEAWKKRHAAEIAARSEGEWVEMEMGESDESGPPFALSVEDGAGPRHRGAIEHPPEPPAYRAVISEIVEPIGNPGAGVLRDDTPSIRPAGALLELGTGDARSPLEDEPTGEESPPTAGATSAGDASTPDGGTPDR